MNNKEFEYGNPFNIFIKSKEELEKKGVEIRVINYDPEIFGSWYILFLYKDSEYKWIWDGKNFWFILQLNTRRGPGTKKWEDLEIYKYRNISGKLQEKLKDIEKFIIKSLYASLDLLKEK